MKKAMKMMIMKKGRRMRICAKIENINVTTNVD